MEDEISRKLKIKGLSFYDYNEEKKNLLEITPSIPGMDQHRKSFKSMNGENIPWNLDDGDTDNSDIESISSFQSMDEGAIAVLSME